MGAATVKRSKENIFILISTKILDVMEKFRGIQFSQFRSTVFKSVK